MSVVVATGARGPAGLRAIDTAFLLRASAPVLRAAPLIDADGQRVTMGFLPILEPRLPGIERSRALAEAALLEVALGLGPGASALRARLALAFDAPHGDDAGDAPLAGDLGRALGRHVASLEIEVEARGAAAAAYLVPDALAALEAGTVDVAIVGGVHSDHDPRRIARLDVQGRIFRSDRLDALVPGEHAAFVAMMRADVARRARLPPMAAVRAVATGWERARPDNDESALVAAGLTAAVRQAQRAAGGEPIGWVVTDLTFETFRHLELSAATTRTQEGFCEPQVFDHPAQRVGHLGAAALPLGMVYVAEGLLRGFAPHARAMVLAGSDGGERGAIVLTAA